MLQCFHNAMSRFFLKFIENHAFSPILQLSNFLSNTLGIELK